MPFAGTVDFYFRKDSDFVRNTGVFRIFCLPLCRLYDRSNGLRFVCGFGGCRDGLQGVEINRNSLMIRKIMLLGSGELGKEFVIAAQRLGQTVVACDSYAGAPAMQVADAAEVFDMLDGDALAAAVAKHRPDLIVPEIEAIRTERLYDFERQGIRVTPSARAVNFTMNRKAIRDLAAKELGLRTAKYFYAKTYEELCEAAVKIGFPCVVKPLMSSSPIGHVQKGGDYRESFQSPAISPEHLREAQRMAAAVTEALTGAGIWGVEFFLSKENGVYFSELSPRPHDTGMVTLAGTQNLNEFELHLRAVLGLPIPEITFERIGASAVVLSPEAIPSAPDYEGVEQAMAADPRFDVRIFGKPSARVNRRMGVVVGYAPLGSDLDALRDRVKAAAAKVRVVK